MKHKVIFLAQQVHAPWIEWVKNNAMKICERLSKKTDIIIVSHRWPHNSLKKDIISWIPVHYLLRLTNNKLPQIMYLLVDSFCAYLFIRKQKPKKVFIQYLDASYLLVIVLLKVFSPKLQIILTLYSTDEVSIWYKKKFLKYFRFKKIIIISEYLRLFVRDFGYSDKDIIYIPLSYDKQRYLNYTNPKSRNMQKILFSAWPSIDAGSHFMVDLAKTMPEYTFIFTLREFNKKSEDEVSLLKKYIKKRGVNNIEIYRNINNMQELLSQVWAIVLPLQTQNIKMLVPVALLEAMSRWTNCFVSDFDHLEFLVQDGENAIIFDKNSIEDLKVKLTAHISNTNIWKQAYTFSKQYPSFEEISEKYFKLI